MREIVFASTRDRLTAGRASVRLPGWKSRRLPWKAFENQTKLSAVTVVRMSASPSESLQSVASKLAEKQRITTEPNFIILHFPGQRRPNAESLTRILGEFGSPEMVEFFSESEAQIEKFLVPICAKLEVIGKRRGTLAISQPLEVSAGWTQVTADLHADNGRLHARKAMEVFGLKEAELARALCVQRQTLHKTPDSPGIQQPLRLFERAARLRVIFRNDAEFRAWLRAPLASLDQAAPLDLLLGNGGRVVAELAEDILTGSLT